MPLAVLTRMKEFGLAANFISIGIQGEAATYRAMMSSGVYHKMAAEITRARKSRYSCLRWWNCGGVLGHFAKVKEHVEYVGCTLPVEVVGLQQWAAKILFDSIPLKTLDECLARRLSTFLKEEISPEKAATARLSIFAAKGSVSRCAVAFVLRTICNAWTTTGRFSGPTAGCPFGCGTPEADKFSHFPACASLRDLWQEVCPGAAPIFQHLTPAIITLTAPMLSAEEVVQLVLWSDVVGQCLNDARACSPPSAIQGAAGRNTLVARLRFLGVQCGPARSVIRRMRSLFPICST